nr:GDSL-type esterase/lipase family protein [Arthrobacter globiformis]
MVNMSVSGSQPNMYESHRGLGAYVLPQADLICYSLGANDAATAVAAATYTTNVKNMIAHKQSRYPGGTMIVFGPAPDENNTNETNAIAIRTAASVAAFEANDPKVAYVNLGGAFDRTVSGNYASTDPTGSRIHPSDVGKRRSSRSSDVPGR